MTTRILIITFILCCVSSAYSQDCLDKLVKQAVLIDSLQKVIKVEKNQFNNLMTTTQSTRNSLSDTIKSLKADLADMEKYKLQKKSIENQIKIKSDSIAFLKIQISEKQKQITVISQKGDQKAREENERGKAESLANLVITYKKPFDDIIKSSSKESVQRDIQLIGNKTEVRQILNDLQTYFNAIELLAKKFDMAQINNAQILLNQIKQNSVLLSNMKTSISKYQKFNDGLKETLKNIVKLDKDEEVKGMGDEIQKQKFNKIMSGLSRYIFDYDFNFTDYPYLSDIVLELIKRKQPNADADITDLLMKL